MEIILIIFGAIVVLFIGFFIYSILDESMAKKGGEYDAVVIQRDYTPEADSTGVGPAIGSNGGIAVTFSHEDEKWVLICKLNGEIEPIETSKENWAKYDKGDKVKIEYTLGYWSNEVYLGDLIPHSIT